MKLLILAEKPDQCRKYAKNLGGMNGQFEGNYYQLAHAQGHLMQLKSPDNQVRDPALKKRYGDWSHLNYFPWNVHDFAWAKTYGYLASPTSRRKGGKSTKNLVESIKNAAKGVDAIVIATDNDPSGEGDLIAWEIIDAINWHGKVYREHHSSEEAAPFKQSLRDKTDAYSKADQGILKKAEARQRFDFASMQLSRIATILARKGGFNVKAVRMGRLKSVIIDLVFRQTLARENYVKKPFYEVRYKDGNGNIFKREYHDGDPWRFTDEVQGKYDLQKYHDQNINIDSTVNKKQAPPKMMDLSGLSVLLGKQGFSTKQVLKTYQDMYQDGYLSYPRTEDDAMTIDQYKALLPLRNQIANVVGVDPNLLTHLTPRKKHITKSAAHGANRPGLKVPDSLGAIKLKYGACGKAIYEAIAKSYLAILGEDYEYQQIKAHLVPMIAFKSQVNIPKKLNYKQIFDENSLKDKPENGKDENKNTGKGFTKMATPYLYMGSNPKPRKPTEGFIAGFLKRNNIGTAATQMQTLTDISNGQNAALKESRNVYSLTDLGWLSAFLGYKTMIASPKTTKQVFDLMKQVQEYKVPMEKIPELMAIIVKHDLPVMERNLQGLIKSPKMLAHVKKMQGSVKPKAKGEFEGHQITFNESWGGHQFTKIEKEKLLAGRMITFKFKTKAGKVSEVSGYLQKQTYKGHPFYGFKPDWNAGKN